MDFLGLRTLTVIQNATKMAQSVTAIEIDLLHIDYNDPKVLGMIGASKTVGVFQLESAGMKNFMKELKPQSLEDIIAGISLYRPGPMDFIPQYIKGKNNPESVTYDYTAAKADSGADLRLYRLPGTGYADRTGTGGLFAWTGRPGAPCDVEEKGIRHGKRAPEFRLWKRGRGRAGLYANGIDEKTANKIYDEMIDFAKYAFNKSHAAAYAVVSYQTAWLKYYYPVEFMAALMTSCIDNPGKVSEYIYEFPPDGHFHSAAGHQPKRRKILGGRPGDPLWHGGGQRHRKAGHGGDRGRAKCKRRRSAR